MTISSPGRGLVRRLCVAAAAIIAFTATSQQRAEALSLASPGMAPSAKYATDGTTIQVHDRYGRGRRGYYGGGGYRGGGGYHGGGGYRGGGATYHGGGHSGGGAIRGGGFEPAPGFQPAPGFRPGGSAY